MLEGINWFDAVVIALIVLFGLRGLANGIIKEIFGILGLIGGLILAVRYKAMAGAWISEKIYNLKSATSVLSGDSTELLAGFLAILFGTWIICLILGEIISKFFKWSGLGFVDKLGGFIFSSAKIFLIFAVVATMIKGSALLNEQTKGFFSTSAVYPHLVNVVAYNISIVMPISTYRSPRHPILLKNWHIAVPVLLLIRLMLLQVRNRLRIPPAAINVVRT